MQDHRLTAILGPTNTGKTYFALERMLAHESGIMGFPLRLLARENYDRAVSLKGRQQVALITGEEKILPKGARYFFCTVESMPLERPVSFVAIDEIQLMADPERGHIFTDRLLHSRGMRESMVLGSLSAQAAICKLCPDVQVIERPRFSTLTYTGAKKITRLPRRSAIVAFSIAEIYAIADLLRRQSGGAAIVLGALSPRARNAQVALYQSGEVDHLIATDAIGMGLNLDVHHVAFANLRKFDGKQYRPLSLAEMSQIAGRAGRHLQDGTFGTTGKAGEIDPETIAALENHKTEPLTQIYWRHADLDFRSGAHLLRSLDRRPDHPLLIRQTQGEDHLVLQDLWRDPEIRALSQGRDATQLLWDVCQVPDFRKLMNDSHHRLLAQLFRYLIQGPLPSDWVKGQMDALDKTQGDIDNLMQRLAYIRTWAFIAHRRDWLKDALHWQAMAGQIEDRLSDALHEALTQRFIDRRKTVLTRQLKKNDSIAGYVDSDKSVLIEGHVAGWLHHWKFTPAQTSRYEERRQLIHAASRLIRPTIRNNVENFLGQSMNALHLSLDGSLSWEDVSIAKLIPGSNPLRPDMKLLETDLLEPAERELIAGHLQHLFSRFLRQQLAPLYLLGEADLPRSARGLAYRLVEHMGAIDRRQAHPQIAALDISARKALRDKGVRLGHATLWVNGLEGSEKRDLLGLLYLLFHGDPNGDKASLETYHLARGERWIEGKILSFNRLEFIARALHSRIAKGKSEMNKNLAKHLRIPAGLLPPLAELLHLRIVKRNGKSYLGFLKQEEPRREALEGSPFAGLASFDWGKKNGR